MKLNTAPLMWDLDAQGNVAPQVTPNANVQPVTFNLSGLDGRTEDLWNYIQAVWVHVQFTANNSTSGTAVNHDSLYNVVDSFNAYSPVLGDHLAQKSNQGPAVALFDQVLGAGYQQPVPYGQGVSVAAGNQAKGVYYRIPMALDCYGRPQDTGPWAPLYEKGKLVVNISPSGTVFAANATLAASAVTVTAAFEILPFGTAQIFAPSKFVRYEFNTSGVQLKVLSFGNGDGLLGINPGARLAALVWLSNNVHLGGVGTPDVWTRISLPWRHQRVLNNADMMMAAFLAATARARVVGNSTAGIADDSEGWPYVQSAPIGASVLASSALFYPIVWPGRETNLTAAQKQVGDLQIDAGFSANPNGTHVFRTLEHYSWQPTMVTKQMGLMGFDTKTYTAQPKTSDNVNPAKVKDTQLWGLPLRIVERARATMPVV